MNSPAKILWISCVGEKGGAEVYMLNVLRHLDRTRFQPLVALLRPGPLLVDLAALGVQTFVLETHRMRNVWAVGKSIRALTKIIQAEDIRLIHSNGFRAHVYGGLAAKSAGIPEVWLTHTAEKSGLITSLIQTIPTAHVTANCPRTADYFVAHGFPTSLIWPGVDVERLSIGTPRAELAARYGLPAAARWISMGARLQRFKGQDYFIRALAACASDATDAAGVQGIIIGGNLFGLEQDYLGELKSLAVSLGLDRRIHFTGFISDADVYGFLAASELVVHPALEEDFGLIVAEAQALARPVLAFASVGPAAIVADGETGRLVPVGDERRLTAALGEMLAQPADLRRWGEAGRERSVRLFGAPACTRQLERVYAACLRGRP
jgi:glycosyltransferase involved in cell wall biosynthesis